jgi:hypothetical protein
VIQNLELQKKPGAYPVKLVNPGDFSGLRIVR